MKHGMKVVQLVGFSPYSSSIDLPKVPIAIPCEVMRQSVVVSIMKFVSWHPEHLTTLAAVQAKAKWERAYQIHTPVGVFEVTQNSYLLAMEDHPNEVPVPPDEESVEEIEKSRRHDE